VPLQATRDRLWQQQRQMKEETVFVTNPKLLQDMQVSSAWPGKAGLGRPRQDEAFAVGSQLHPNRRDWHYTRLRNCSS